MEKPSIFCITGGIGAGKSVVSRILRCNGLQVYDCDTEAKRLMSCDPEVRRQLCEQIGSDVFQRNGELDKNYLRNLIFNDDIARRKVNGIVHTAVREDIIEKSRKAPSPFYIETAIPVTSSIDKICKEIWYVTAPVDERITRIKGRDGLSEADIRLRIKTQDIEYDTLSSEKVKIIINDNDNNILLLVMRMAGLLVDRNETIIEYSK